MASFAPLRCRPSSRSWRTLRYIQLGPPPEQLRSSIVLRRLAHVGAAIGRTSSARGRAQRNLRRKVTLNSGRWIDLRPCQQEAPPMRSAHFSVIVPRRFLLSCFAGELDRGAPGRDDASSSSAYQSASRRGSGVPASRWDSDPNRVPPVLSCPAIAESALGASSVTDTPCSRSGRATERDVCGPREPGFFTVPGSCLKEL